MMKSQSVEDYLKAIFHIQENQNGKPVSTSSLAALLGITDASVTGMLKRYSSVDPKLLEYEPYAGVTLTHEGAKLALEVIRHHRLIESYLNQALGYSWDEVHEEADRLEHVISETMEDRMARALGDPVTDPHGDPIPDREGNLRQMDSIPLAQLPDSHSAIIQRITWQEPALLRYLADQGLTLSTQVRVVSKAPFNGPVSIVIKGRSESTLALSREVADKILVLPVLDPVVERTYE
jgi:DtxR family transcriptional regulator, Mn-dependent transcriptional regulator